MWSIQKPFKFVTHSCYMTGMQIMKRAWLTRTQPCELQEDHPCRNIHKQQTGTHSHIDSKQQASRHKPRLCHCRRTATITV